jgi:hypothetical protein
LPGILKDGILWGNMMRMELRLENEDVIPDVENYFAF